MQRAASGTSLQALHLKETEVKDMKKVSSIFSRACDIERDTEWKN